MFNKIGFGLALTAAFGLMACSDSSSGSDSGKVTLHCKVLKEEPLTLQHSEGGMSFKSVYELTPEGKMKTTYEFPSESIAKEECADSKGDDSIDVTCDGKKVIEISKESSSKNEFKTMVTAIKDDCVESDGQTVTIDKDGYIVDDDDDDDDDDGDAGPATESSCDFDINADAWEYTFTNEDDFDKSEGSVRYEFDGKDYTVVRITKSTSKDASQTCTEDAADSYNDEFSDATISKKTEASCDGKTLVLKTTDTYRNYEEEFGYTKQQLMYTLAASCRAGY